MASATPVPLESNAAAAPHGLEVRRGASGFRPIACDWCYAREMLLPMSIGMIVIMLAFAGNFVYWAINSIVNRGMSIAPVVRMFILAMPGFAVQGIPAGVILAVCLVLNRAVRDNEVIALRVGGASLPRIVMPFLLMSLLASVGDWLLVEKVAPVTNDMAEKELLRLMARSAVPLIESDKYFRAGQYYFYVESVENGVLHNVMVYERGSSTYGAFVPQTFPIVRLARVAHEDAKVPGRWIFEDVVQHIYNADGSQLSEARAKVVKLDVGQQLKTYWTDEKQPFSMTSDELSQRIKDLDNAAYDPSRLQQLRVDYYRRYALPLACFVMALVAAPLALRFARQGSFAGLVLAFVLAFLWQGFDGWLRALGIAGYLPPVVAAGATDALFILVGATLLWRER
jgi:lipopolysaccharide export system permease protein